MQYRARVRAVAQPSSPWVLEWAAVLVACGAASTACAAETPTAAPARAPSDESALLEDDDAAENAVLPPSNDEVKQGIEALKAGDFARARDALQQAATHNPKDLQAVFYLGVALDGLGEAEAAIAQYRKALELDPKFLEASVNLSASLLDKQDAAGALEVVNAALTHHAGHAGLLQNRGYALSAQGDAGGAAIALQQALDAEPTNDGLRYSYAEALLAAERPEEARDQLRQLTDSESVEVLASAARMLAGMKEFKLCVTALDKALPGSASAELFVSRGLCKHGLKDEAGAQADYEQATQVDPKYAPGFYYLGQHLKLLGKKAEARSALSKAEQLGRGTPIAAAAAKAMKGL